MSSISVTETTFVKNLYDSVAALPLAVRTPGPYTAKITTRGNALLSSLYVKSGTGTVEVKYYDTTTGESFGERFDINQHDIKDGTADAGTTNRIVVTLIHDKTVVEATVVGGSVEFGVYASLIHQPAGSVFEGFNYLRHPALPVLPARYPNGNLAYFPLTLSGKVPVDSEADLLAPLRAEGEIAGTTTEATVCAIPLTPGASYRKVGWLGSCFRNAKFRIIFHDNGADTVLGRFRVGDQQHNDRDTQDWPFTAGLTGTQELRLRAANISVLSDLSGSLSVQEVQTP